MQGLLKSHDSLVNIVADRNGAIAGGAMGAIISFTLVIIILVLLIIKLRTRASKQHSKDMFLPHACTAGVEHACMCTCRNRLTFDLSFKSSYISCMIDLDVHVKN